ncbi:MAG: zinc ribbon domain-containing protein [Eubacterium sp.]|nr:zinc ribbon domain-containing protein [Eubacterium sp.]
MFCPKCGQRVPDASKFCQSCGAKLLEASIDEAAGVDQSVLNIVDPPEEKPEPEPEVEAPVTASTAEPEVEAQVAEQSEEKVEPDVEQAEAAAEMAMGGAATQTAQAPQAESFVGAESMGAGQQVAAVGGTVMKKGLSKPVLFGVIGGGVFLVAAAVTLVIVFLIIGNSKTYNLKDYTEVTFEGVDGSGKATAKLKEDLSLQIAEGLGLDVEKMKQNDGRGLDEILDFAGSNFSDIMNIYYAISSIKLTLDKEDNLKNGDTVTVTYTFDQEKAKEVKAEFVADPLVVTVSGLEEVKEVDPFEGLEVSFEGTAPNAYVSYNYKSTEEWGYMVYFAVDKSDGLKEGDTVTFRVEGYNEDKFAKDFGVRFTQTEKAYTVDKVEGYLTANQDIDSAALDIMKSATEGYIKEYFEEGSRKDAIKASDISYEGYYFLTNKKSDVWYGINKVYMVYSATVSSKEKDKKFKPKKVFFPVEYDDVKHLADGSYEINTSYKRILGSTDMQFGYWEVVSGYTDKATMYDELITADSAEYDGAAYDNLK